MGFLTKLSVHVATHISHPVFLIYFQQLPQFHIILIDRNNDQNYKIKTQIVITRLFYENSDISDHLSIISILTLLVVSFVMFPFLNSVFPPFCYQKKANGAPNGFYGEIDWDRYVSKRSLLLVSLALLLFDVSDQAATLQLQCDILLLVLCCVNQCHVTLDLKLPSKRCEQSDSCIFCESAGASARKLTVSGKPSVKSNPHLYAELFTGKSLAMPLLQCAMDWK